MLPELFLERSDEFPDAPAVLSGCGVLTYRELERSARRIAGSLSELGVGNESVVGVVLAPGPDMVASLLGIWLAGGCYLPLDPLDPPERLHRVLRSSGAGLVVRGGDHPATQPAPDVGATFVDIGELRESGNPTWAPSRLTHPRQAAYMIFTSGSTGAPKGVVIEHEGIANRVRWGVSALELTAADRVLQKTPLTFDPAGWEIFAPLICGAPVTFGHPDAGRDPAELVRSIRERRATVVQVVPTMLRMLAAEADLASCDSLRLVCSGGEPLQAELCQRILRELDVEIWNTYGPTECSVDFMAAQFDPGQQSGAVPIGHPIDHAGCQLVAHTDESAADAPVQEIYARGACVGRGYHGDPVLTAERFLPDPSGPPGARMFRTGDLVRDHPRGGVEFVRRADTQVKINGVRIEPVEIEAVLQTHPEVTAAAVRTVEDPHGIRRLAACVVARGDAEAADVTAYLRDRLPPAMVPAVVMKVDALPWTTSGKIDRSRLPEPDWTQRSSQREPAASLTTEEASVLAAWRELLDIEDAHLDDDFFRLGGHSLMLIRLAHSLAGSHGVELDFRDLHLATTARDQARLLAKAVRAKEIDLLPPGARLPLSPGQERFWVLDRMNPSSREYVLPVLVWLPARIHERTVKQALHRLTERHEVLRTRYIMDSEGLSAVVSPTVRVPLRTAVSTPDGLRDLVAEELGHSFDLSAAPVWRAALLRDGGPEQLLLLVCHHIICDGWSATLLEREINELVAAIDERRPAELADLPMRYVDAVAWQRSQFTDEKAADELNYWRTALAELPDLNLPDARVRGAERSIQGAAVRFDLPKNVVEPLLDTGRRVGATPFVTFLTLWNVLLARAGGRWDFGVGTPHAGRSRPELHGLVGLFINVVVVRSRIRPDMTFVEAFTRVGQACKEAFAHHAVPFEAVVEAAAPDRDLSRTPVAQTMFFMAGGDSADSTARERDLELLEHAWATARTDLTLHLWSHEGGRYGGVLEYATALFSDAIAADLAEEFRALATLAAADPDVPVGADAGRPISPAAPVLKPHEETILQFVRDLLEQAHVGFEDNILDRGGNSLKAARLLWNVQQEFGVVVPMRAFFDSPTAAGIARAVEEAVPPESADPQPHSDVPGRERA
ncbi:amino acid adenylation domain-containing protein [Streptomyces sp. NPDC006602]|uniref:amino acid adenylation domain-containing protein n=1 Tax=Streptomyces sp. NPDC006602 TaxID=3364751 RepID=UPI00368686EB